MTVVAIVLFTFGSPAESQGKKKAKTPIWSDQKDAHGDLLPIGAIARIGTVRYRINERGMFFMPAATSDGKLLAIPGAQDGIELFELPAWNKLRTIRSRDLDKKDHPNVFNLAFSRDGKKLAAADSNRHCVYLIDVATGKSLKKIDLPHKDPTNGPQLLLGRDDKTLIWGVPLNKGNGQHFTYHVWDLEKEKLRHTIEVPTNTFDGRQSTPMLSEDSRWLVLTTSKQMPMPGGNNNFEMFIEFWDLNTGKAERKIETEMPMNLTALSPDGKWLAAAGSVSTLRIYDATTGKEVHNIRLRRSTPSLLRFTPDSKALYMADHGGSVMRFDPVRGERIEEKKAPVEMAPVRQLFFGADGKTRALAHDMSALFFWEIETGKVFSPVGLPAGMIDDLSFAPSGELFVSAEDGHAAWWNPRTAVKLRDLKLEFQDAFRDSILYDGPGLGVPVPVRPQSRYDGFRGGMLTMSPDARYLTSGDGGATGVYDVKTGKLLYEDDSRFQLNGNSGLIFLDGGQKLASMQQKKIRIWNTSTGRDLAKFDVPIRAGEFTLHMAATPNGKHFAFGTANNEGQGRVLLWDTAKNAVVREWASQDRQDAMRFSPDNLWLAVSSSRNEVRLTRVDKPAGDYVLPLRKNSDEISQLRFSPDGRQLACAMIVPSPNYDSGKIVIFEVASKKPRLELVGHANGFIDRLAYSPNGEMLASGSSDTTVLVWRAGLRAFLPGVGAKNREAGPATPEELEARFKQLAGLDAKLAFQDMIKLGQTPAQTIKLLEEKIAPAPKPVSGEKTVAQWIQDLASSQFATRNKASAALIKIGASVEPDLRGALRLAKDVETRRRIEGLLDQFAVLEWTADEVRHARAVELLEAIGTKKARAVLTRWAGGDPGAVLTQQARQALDRK